MNRFVFAVLLIFTTLSGYAQNFDEADEADIQIRAEAIIQDFEKLMNNIADPNYRYNSIINIIEGSYSEKRSYVQLFRDSLVIVESDLHPQSSPDQLISDLTIDRYLRDFNLYYDKSPSTAVIFRIDSISDVKSKDYLYVNVYFRSRFLNPHRAFGRSVGLKQRVATLRAFEENNTWHLLISGIGFVRVGEEPRDGSIISGRFVSNNQEIEKPDDLEVDELAKTGNASIDLPNTANSTRGIVGVDTEQIRRSIAETDALLAAQEESQVPDDDTITVSINPTDSGQNEVPPQIEANIDEGSDVPVNNSTNFEPEDNLRQFTDDELALKNIRFNNTLSAYQRDRSYAITWTNNTSNQDKDLKLYKGEQEVATLQPSVIDNRYFWSVPTKLKSGSDYNFRIGNEDLFSRSEQFKIKGRYPTILKAAVAGLVSGAAAYFLLKKSPPKPTVVDELPPPPTDSYNN